MPPSSVLSSEDKKVQTDTRFSGSKQRWGLTIVHRRVLFRLVSGCACLSRRDPALTKLRFTISMNTGIREDGPGLHNVLSYMKLMNDASIYSVPSITLSGMQSVLNKA